MSTMTTSSSPTPAMDVFWENVRTILYALALALLLRFTIAQPFRIPSGSMQPTLEVGDYIVVTKWSYGYGRFSFAPFEGLLPRGRLFNAPPHRGDVIVFRPPPAENKDFIKRLVGLPGDRIQVIDGVLHINGEPVQREDLGEVDFRDQDGTIERIHAYRETLPGGGPSYTTFDRYPNGELDQTRVFVVPEGHYFLMGDDRDNSADSRTGTVGYVPYDNLVGPAQFVVVSFDSTAQLAPWTWFSGFRGERFMKRVE